MKQNILVVAIISGAVCFGIGLVSGTLLTMPNREKTETTIAAIEAKAEKAQTIAQKQIQAAKAEIARFQNEIYLLTAKLEQADNELENVIVNLKRAEDAVKTATKERDDAKAEIALLKSKSKPIATKRASKKGKNKLSTYEKQEAILRRELEGFFLDIPKVKWVRFDGNTIYVGFSTYPSDGNAILRGAALHGNKAINFGCHVWAVHADQKNNPPYYGTLSDKWYDEVTVRYGRFK